MPPRWSRQPDRNDPAYRKLDDRMNFAVHVAIFALINSGLWFFRILGDTSDLGVPKALLWTPWITLSTAMLLIAHAVFIFAIAQYPDQTLTGSTGMGFQPKTEKKATKSVKG